MSRVDPSGARVIMHSKRDARNGAGDSADVVIPSGAKESAFAATLSVHEPNAAAFGLPSAAAAGLLHALTRAEEQRLAAGLGWLGGWRGRPRPVISDALHVMAH